MKRRAGLIAAILAALALLAGDGPRDGTGISPASSSPTVKYLVTCFPGARASMPKRPAVVEIPATNAGSYSQTVCGMPAGTLVTCCVAAVDSRGRQSAWSCDTVRTAPDIASGIGSGGTDPTAPCFTIGPNPTSGAVLVSSSTPGTLELFDAVGRPRGRFDITPGIHAKTLPGPAGVYFYRFSAGAHVETGKLTVLH